MLYLHYVAIVLLFKKKKLVNFWKCYPRGKIIITSVVNVIYNTVFVWYNGRFFLTTKEKF